MKKIPIWLVFILIFAALIAIKFIFFAKKVDEKKAKGGNDKPIAVNYAIATLSSESNALYTTGKVGALNEIVLNSEIAGKVVGIFFNEGDFVNKGAMLVKLNDAELQAQLQKNAAQANLVKEKVERLQKLYSINGVSKEELTSQENELAILKADENYLRAQLAKTVISAPFSGMIGLKNISIGSYISPNVAIANFVQTKPVYIEFSAPEKYISTIKKGMNINFKADNDHTLSAQIYAIEPKIDESTKTLKARAIYNGGENLYNGTFVKVLLDIDKAANAIFIPTQAIVPTMKGQKVYIAENGIAVEREVQTGMRTEDKIQITDGLKVGDSIITTGVLALKKETKVNLIQENK